MRRAAYNMQANCAMGAVVLAGTWQQSGTLRRYSRNALMLTAVGLGLMYVAVSHLSVNVFVAQMLVVSPIMFGISLVIHNDISFRNKRLSGCNTRRYAAVRIGGMGVSKISFFLLVSFLGVQYLLASVIISSLLAAPTYKLNRDWAFKPEPRYTPDAIRRQIGLTSNLPIR